MFIQREQAQQIHNLLSPSPAKQVNEVLSILAYNTENSTNLIKLHSFKSISKTPHTGYDLGASNYPVEPNKNIAVDIKHLTDEEAGNIRRMRDSHISSGPKTAQIVSVKRDLRKKNWNLPPKDNIRAGQVLRYLGKNVEEGEDVKPHHDEVYRNFVENIHNTLNPGGTFTIRDYQPHTHEVVKRLKEKGYKVTYRERLYPAEKWVDKSGRKRLEHATWEFRLRKPKVVE